MKTDIFHQFKGLGKREVLVELMYFIRDYDTDFYCKWIRDEYLDMDGRLSE